MLSCSACRHPDPASATVKVNPALITSLDKENVRPNTAIDTYSNHVAKQCEGTDRKRKSREISELQRQEHERVEAELQAQSEAEHKQQHRHALKQRIADELAVAEEARRAQEQAEEAELQRRKKAVAYELERARQENEDTDRLYAFLASKGYGEDVNSKRKTLRKFYYPLHDAVAAKDADLIRILLKAGANPTLRSSSGKTALERAQKCNRNGSLDDVCVMLEAAR